MINKSSISNAKVNNLILWLLQVYEKMLKIKLREFLFHVEFYIFDFLKLKSNEKQTLFSLLNLD